MLHYVYNHLDKNFLCFHYLEMSLLYQQRKQVPEWTNQTLAIERASPIAAAKRRFSC